MVFTSHSDMEKAAADWFREKHGQLEKPIFCEWSDLLHRSSSNFHRFHRNQTEVRAVTQKSPLPSVATTPVYSPSPPRNQQKMSPQAQKTSSQKPVAADVLTKAPSLVQDTREE